MDEKTMVSDALVGINGELKMYAEYITQSENPQLKQTLKQMRNKTETAQEQLYQIARVPWQAVPTAVDGGCLFAGSGRPGKHGCSNRSAVFGLSIPFSCFFGK